MPPNPYYNVKLHVMCTSMLKKTYRVVTPRVCLQLLNPYYNPLSVVVPGVRNGVGGRFSGNTFLKRNSACYCGILVANSFFEAVPGVRNGVGFGLSLAILCGIIIPA